MIAHGGVLDQPADVARDCRRSAPLLPALNVDGDMLVYSPAEIFAHAMLHERQHHGDVNTLLSQLGIEIPIVEFRFSLAGREL